jgi:outer membrane cobalamin receptor
MSPYPAWSRRAVAVGRAPAPPLRQLRALCLCALLLAPRARAAADEPAPTGEPLLQPEVVVLVEPLAPSAARAPAAQRTVVEVARFAGEARTLGELLVSAPGVSLLQTGGPGQESQFSLRGATADQTLLLLDGIPLQGPGGGAVDLATLPASLVGSLVVSRGVLGAQLGAGALGGALELQPRSAPASGRELGLQLSGGSFGTAQLVADVAGSSERLGTWSAGLQLDRTSGDFPYAVKLQPSLPDAPYYGMERQNDDAQRAGLLVHGSVPLGDRLQLDLLGQGTAGDRGLPGTSALLTPNAREADQSGLLGARLRGLLGDAVLSGRAWVRGSLIELRGLGTSLVDCIGPNPSPACALQETHTLGSRAELELGLAPLPGHWVTLQLSGGGEWLAGDFTGIHRRGLGSLALADDLALAGGALSLHPAVRFDLVGADAAVSPGLGAVFRPVATGPLAGLTLRAGAGLSFRPPSFSELYLDQGLTLPNPELKPERAGSVDAGLGWQGGAVSASFGLFWSRYRDLILYELYPPERVKPQNIGAARIAGSELQVSVQLPLGAALDASWSWLDAVNERPSATEEGRALPYRAPQRIFARLSRRGDRIEAFCQGTFSSALPRNATATTELPAQLRLDAGAGARLAGPLWVDLVVRNLLDDQTQQDLFQYPLPGASLLATARARF